MMIKISFRHMDHTDALDIKIKEKCQKLERFLGKNAKVSWTCIADKAAQISEVHVTNNGDDFHAHAEADDLYKTFDQCITKLTHQLEKNNKTERAHDSIKNHF